MSADVQTPAAVADQPVAPGQGLWRYLAMPCFVAVALGALYLYVSSQELDRIEAVRLTPEFIAASTVRHLYLVGVSTVLVILIAVPLGILLTRPFARRVSPSIVAVTSTAQSVPSIGVVVLLALFFNLGVRIAIVALVVYAFVPVLRNTMVGLQQVDESVMEAGRGMGLTKRGVLTQIELPLSVPVMLAGVRTALVINVGTAAIATLINAGGLGDVIYTGLVQNRTIVTLTGAVLTGSLALMVDYIAGIAEDVLRPKGL
ncbi:MAG: ABC transporter permease [Euzebyales bacterium]|jgi:osmoprotectant transport system permease protein|nr:ABC transporter permease [Euzebyales bacterium]